MIKVFLPNDTDYSSNGEIILKNIEAYTTKNQEEEYLELEAPLKYAEFLVQSNILIVDTLSGKKGYRIHNPIMDETLISVKAWICYQENASAPADRGVVISHGKNLENCKIEETWDDVVTKITPIGYNKAVLPEGFLSVVHTYPRDYDKTIEFELSESLEETIKTHEEIISIMESLETALKTSVATLQAKYDAYDTSIASLQYDITELQGRLRELNRDDLSDVEKKEKATIEAQIPLIEADIISLTTEKENTLTALSKAQADLVIASQDVIDTTAEYNNVIIDDLRTQAQAYLSANQYPKINYDLEAHLDGIVEVGDIIHVKHPAMRVDLLTNVISYVWDCISRKFTEIQFGTATISLKSKFTEVEEAIEKVGKEVNNADGTISKYYSSYKRDNAETVSQFIEELYGSVNGLFGRISKSTSILRQTAAEISATVNRLNADTSEDIASLVIRADSIASTVEHNYTDLSGKISTNATQITQTATEIRAEATATETNLQGQITSNTSLISQTATSIRSEVTTKFTGYSTTTVMNSAITQSATSIVSTVNTTINGVVEDMTEIEQTANKIKWLVKSGTSSTDFLMTDRAISLVAESINLTGYVTINNLGTAGAVEIDAGNLKASGTISGLKFTNGAVTIDSADIIVTAPSGYLKAKFGTTTFKLIGYSGANNIIIGDSSYNGGSTLVMKQRHVTIGYSAATDYPSELLINAYKIGLYGSPAVAKQSVNKVYTASISTAMLADRFNVLLTALNTVGLINASSTS